MRLYREDERRKASRCFSLLQQQKQLCVLHIGTVFETVNVKTDQLETTNYQINMVLESVAENGPFLDKINCLLNYLMSQ